jgi:hypothetical protein
MTKKVKNATGNGNKDGNVDPADKQNPGSSLALTSAWQHVPASVRSGGTRSTTTTTTTSNKTDMEFKEEGFTIVTTNNFDTFQALIARIVNSIAKDPKLKDHKFVKNWKTVQINQVNPVNEHSTFRTVSKAFKLSDLKDYSRFLRTCPSIENYVELPEPNKSSGTGFLYRVVHNTSEISGTGTDVQIGDDELEQNETLMNNEGYMECCGTTTDFMVLLHQVWMIFDKMRQEGVSTDHTKIWQQWIDNGLNITTTFQNMKTITQFEGLYEFYYFIKECPEIITILDVKWENKILYRFNLHQKSDLEHEQTLSTASSETVFEGEINNTGITTVVSSTTPNTIRHPNGTTTETAKLMDAGLGLPKVDASIKSEEWDELDTAEVEIYTVSTIDLDTSFEFVLLHSFIHDTIATWTVANVKDPFTQDWLKWVFKGLTRDKMFQKVKTILGITTLREYLQTMQKCPVITNRLAWEWQGDKLKYWILPDDMGNPEDCTQTPAKILSLKSDLKVFSNRFNMTLKEVNNKMKDALFRLDILDERSKRYEKTVERTVHQQGQRLMTEHSDTIKRITENLIEDQRVALENIAKETVKKFKSDTIAIITTFDSEVACKVQTFKQHLDTLSVSSVAASQETLGSTMVKLVNDLQSAATDVTNNISVLAEEHMAAIQKSTADIQPMDKQNQPGYVHPLFPNVDIEKIYAAPARSIPKHAPQDSTPNIPDTNAEQQPSGDTTTASPDIRDPTASPKRIPVPERQQWQPQHTQVAHAPYQYGHAYPEPTIPYLQYDNVMKRAQVQYTGEEDVLVFYNQLRNGVEHYGLYLIEVVQFELGKSLCPKAYKGYIIDDERYRLMAGCLYQKLVSFDTIPAEFTSARTVINTYAEANDGYKVLYTMIEPLLETDDIPTPPTSDEWPDIHAYATKFQSWKNCEALKGRSFAPKELTKTFLNGLSPAYHPAVRRARALLDNRSPADPTVPEVLKISKLPVTLKRWLKEETGQSVVRTTYSLNAQPEPDIEAIIRAAYGGKRIPLANTNDRNKLSQHQHQLKDVKKPYADKLCNICLRIGHPKSQCIQYARYLICREADQRADDNTRTKVIEYYKTEAKRKSERGRRREQLGTVRQLWAEGHSFEEIEHTLLEAMPDLVTGPDSSDSESDE